MMLYHSDFPSNRSHAGFTFLEVLLAVALSSLLLLSATQVMFSFAHLWGQVEEEPLFQHHVDGVVSFLEECLHDSENLSGNVNRPHGWSVPATSDGNEPLMHFRLDPAPAFFVSETLPTHAVDAWLAFDEEKGLSLLWHIPASFTQGRVEMHETCLSQWVEDVEVGDLNPNGKFYEYVSYGSDGREQRQEAPARVRIVFNQNGRKQMRDLNLLRHDRNVLIY
jgi:prepilin-type N-terminal cleavage/methylation domain-containing protein